MYRNTVKHCEYCNKDISYINWAKHCNTDRHLKKVSDSEEAVLEREKAKIRAQLNNEKICSIIRKLTLDDMKFIVNNTKDIRDALKGEIEYNSRGN